MVLLHVAEEPALELLALDSSPEYKSPPPQPWSMRLPRVNADAHASFEIRLFMTFLMKLTRLGNGLSWTREMDASPWTVILWMLGEGAYPIDMGVGREWVACISEGSKSFG